MRSVAKVLSTRLWQQPFEPSPWLYPWPYPDHSYGPMCFDHEYWPSQKDTYLVQHPVWFLEIGAHEYGGSKMQPPRD